MSAIDSEILERFVSLVGRENAVTEATLQAGYLTEWRGRYKGRTPLVLRPQNTEQVGQIVTYANAVKVPLVVQGGNTGVMGGQIPDESNQQILLSLANLNKIRRFDLEGGTACVEAGVTLEAFQKHVERQGSFFPLSLSSQGSCQIGGTIATDAGGVHVLAHGTMRSLVLGLEVVLPTGEIWDGMRCLVKDRMGYDLKQLFIGAEGTLGIITAAVLKILPAQRCQAHAFVGLPDPAASLRLLTLLRREAGPFLTAYELLPRLGLTYVVRHRTDLRDPLPIPCPWYALIELSSSSTRFDVQGCLQEVLEEALEHGWVQEGSMAHSLSQAEEFWALRHALSEVQKKEGASLKHDVSVPVAHLPELIACASAAAQDCVPGCRPLPFGHVGDGNLHLNISQPEGMDPDSFLTKAATMEAALFPIVRRLGGSLAAEHGIGRTKVRLLEENRDAVEIDLMHRLKKMLDPNVILNPGCVLNQRRE